MASIIHLQPASINFKAIENTASAQLRLDRTSGFKLLLSGRVVSASILILFDQGIGTQTNSVKQYLVVCSNEDSNDSALYNSSDSYGNWARTRISWSVTTAARYFYIENSNNIQKWTRQRVDNYSSHLITRQATSQKAINWTAESVFSNSPTRSSWPSASSYFGPEKLTYLQ